MLLLLQGLAPDWARLPVLPAPLLFMIAFAIALPINRGTVAAQREQLAFTPKCRARGVDDSRGWRLYRNSERQRNDQGDGHRSGVDIPSALSPWLSQVVAVTSMPLSLVFTPDVYYFGVLPVFAEAAGAAGHDPLAIGRAAILGQMTTGFPLSPMTASTFILLGLSGVSLRDHQRYTFGWALGTTLVMTLVASITGAL